MERLNLELFIKSAEDPEYSKYKLLAIMDRYLDFLHHSKLYPVFSNLIEIRGLLQGIIENKSTIDVSFPKRLISFDLKKKKPVYDSQNIVGKDKNSIFEFIEWAMPQIQEGLDEGKAIYDFVEKNSEIKEIGIIPLYKNEGYLFIRDSKSQAVNVYRYKTVLFSSAEEPLRTLKTKFVASYSNGDIEITSKEIKLQLTKQFPELPNPAVYLFNSEVDFPFKETILPIAKRRLMKTIAA